MTNHRLMIHPKIGETVQTFQTTPSPSDLQLWKLLGTRHYEQLATLYWSEHGEASQRRSKIKIKQAVKEGGYFNVRDSGN